MHTQYDYKKLLEDHGIDSLSALHQLFWDKVAWDWMDLYKDAFKKHGEVTLQRFYTFSFIIDHIWPDQESPELPETRVVGTFGISGVEVNISNRNTMRSYWGSMTKAYGHLGCKFDRGHFIAHGFGGPIDVNLFPQRRMLTADGAPKEKDTGPWNDLSQPTQEPWYSLAPFIPTFPAALPKSNTVTAILL